jgi:hypothetical protein
VDGVGEGQGMRVGIGVEHPGVVIGNSKGARMDGSECMGTHAVVCSCLMGFGEWECACAWNWVVAG